MKIFYVLFLLTFCVNAQEKDKVLPIANDDFNAKNYTEAESKYRISQSKATNKTVASYNLGNAIYRQNQPGEAKFAYAKALEKAKTYTEKHRAFHNLGNTLMKEKNYSAAVEAYKNALRNNPADEETRYNYALAKQKLKENPPKDDKNKDKKKDKDKKDNNKDQDKKKDDKQDSDKDKKDDKNEPKDKDNPSQPKPKPGGISKERLENLLDAVNNEEKKVQDKMNGKKIKGKATKNEKDW